MVFIASVFFHVKGLYIGVTVMLWGQLYISPHLFEMTRGTWFVAVGITMRETYAEILGHTKCIRGPGGGWEGTSV